MSDDPLEPALQNDVLDAGRHRLGAELRRVGRHPLDQVVAGDALGEAGVVVHVGRLDDLAADDGLLQHDGVEQRSPAVECRGQSRRSGSDDDHVALFGGHGWRSP